MAKIIALAFSGTTEIVAPGGDDAVLDDAVLDDSVDVAGDAGEVTR
jgi:hypothetical protein